MVVRIYYAFGTTEVVSLSKEAAGQPSEEFKDYDSYAVGHYEGSLRVQRRHGTPAKTKSYAKEGTERLNRDGARAVFMTECDRRIYALAQAAVKSLGLEVGLGG